MLPVHPGGLPSPAPPVKSAQASYSAQAEGVGFELTAKNAQEARSPPRPLAHGAPEMDVSASIPPARSSRRQGFERIESGNLVGTYMPSKFEDTRHKALKFGANGSTHEAYKPDAS
jgi:hypothetical protein